MTDAFQPTPHQALAARLRDLADAVPQHYATLLAAPEFERGQQALSALRAPGRIEAAVADLSADEAEWFEANLEHHWQRIAPCITDPTLRLVAPDVVWSADTQVTLTLRAEVDGLTDGWDVIWPDRAEPGPTADQAQLTLSIGEKRQVDLSVRVIGHPVSNADDDSRAPRTILTCKKTVLLRPARCEIAPDRLSLIVRDDDGTLAAGLTVEIEGTSVRLNPEGRVAFETPLGEGILPELDGIPLPLEGD